MKKLFLSLFLASLCFADTPPPGSVSAKLYDFQGNGITSTVTGLNRGIDVNLLNSLNVTQGTSPWVVSGTVSATQGTSPWLTSRNWTLSSGTDSVSVSNFPATVAVTQSTSPWVVSGTVTANAGTNLNTSALALDATLSALSAKFNSLGQKTMANSAPIVIASDQTAVPASQSGTWNINNVSGTVSLPTGASTAAKQPAIGTAGTPSADVITVQGVTGMTPISTRAPLNTTGSGSGAGATVSTVSTLTAPANAVGFILMNLDVSTTNMRWAVGRTASTTLGQQLQPGRDTGFVPVGANISIIAESGTVTYDVQWVSQ